MKKWYQVELFNLVVLALLGVMLRYKIIFELPFIEQKNLLRAHSHFAFNRWVGFLLQVLIVDEFTDEYGRSIKSWNRFFIASTIVNYAMIISFVMVGYAGISIVFSTIAMWLSYAFAYKMYKALLLKGRRTTSTRFINAALFCFVVVGALRFGNNNSGSKYPSILVSQRFIFFPSLSVQWFFYICSAGVFNEKT